MLNTAAQRSPGMMRQAVQTRPPMPDEEHQILCDRAADARDRARDLITRCANLQAWSARQRHTYRDVVMAIADVKAQLRGDVVRYAETLRQLGIGRDDAQRLVRQLVDDRQRDLLSGLAGGVAEDVVKWAMQAYRSGAE